jgi:hypothetical protein
MRSRSVSRLASAIALFALLAPAGAGAVAPRGRQLTVGGEGAVVSTADEGRSWLAAAYSWLVGLWDEDNGHVVP